MRPCSGLRLSGTIDAVQCHIWNIGSMETYTAGLGWYSSGVEGTLSLFGLSCRALGREVEGRMIDFVRQRHMIKGIDFVPTGKNGCLKELLGREFPQIIWCKNNQKPAYNLLCIHSLMQLVFG